MPEIWALQAVAQAKFKAGGLLSWLSWNKRNALKNARFNLEYHGIRDAFIAYQQVRRRWLWQWLWPWLWPGRGCDCGCAYA